jgi:hypothetical protein
MKKSLAVVGAIILLSSLGSPVNATETPEAEATTITAPIVAEDATLTPDTVAVTTAPAETEPVLVAEPVEAPQTVSEPVEAPATTEAYAEPVEAPVVVADEPVVFAEPVESVPVEANGNPECQVEGAIQYDDGSCTLPATEVDGQSVDSFVESDGTVVTVDPSTMPEAYEVGIEEAPVENNGNPECQVPGAIQYADGSCTFNYDTQDTSYDGGETQETSYAGKPDPTLPQQPRLLDPVAGKGL